MKAPAFLKRIELPKTESAFTPAGIWSNYDMEPVPREDWSWTMVTFAAYWASDLINAGSFSQVSSFVSLGLAWWEGILALFVGCILLCVVIVHNGIIGARLHTPFAVSARAPFGYKLSRFAVVSRMVIAWFWLSINTYQGGTGITLMLRAIWPSYNHFKNHLAESSGVTSQEMLSFFIFWAIQAPFCLVHPRKLRPIFIIKGIILPITAIATMAWSIHAAGDKAAGVMKASPKFDNNLDHWYAFMTAASSVMSSWSTLACNIGDFARYSKKETTAWVQLGFMPLMMCLVAFLGAVTSNMVYAIYGEVLWQPFQIIAKWEGSRRGRCAAFFASFSWCLGNMGTNITANSISSANDLCTLFPRYVNIFRGQMVAITIGIWAFVPWKVLASASSFLNFMGSYSIVLAPIAGILCSDFFLVKHSKYDVVALYDPRSIYRYTWGFNWRALVALVVSISPNMPGMINALNSDINIGNAKYIFCMSDIFGIIVGGSTHVILHKLFPNRTTLIDECIYPQDVWDGLVPKYEHFSNAAREAEAGIVAAEKGVEDDTSSVKKEVTHEVLAV